MSREPRPAAGGPLGRLTALRDIAVQTGRAFSADGATAWAAALAFYTMLSLGPLLCVAVAACGLLFGHEPAMAAIVGQVQGLLGDEVGETLRAMVAQAAVPRRGVWPMVLGIASLAFGASGVFAALQEAVDAIWHVQPDPRAGIGSMLRRRFLSLAMVGCVGFMLAVSLLLSAAIAALQQLLARALPLGIAAAAALDLGVSLALGTCFFAVLFKVLPDAHLSWRHTWLGAAATAVLFDLGKVAIGLYVRFAEVTSPYGAAGSLALLLIWTYYAAQVIFLGAALTRVCAQRAGAQLRPVAHAVRVEKHVV